MNPRVRALLRAAVLIGIAVILFVAFPKASRAAELAARDLRYFWWVVLLIALAIWLIWGFKKKP